MIRKSVGFLKYYSNLIFPILLFLICLLVSRESTIFALKEEKIASLASVSASLIGVLITILTIYLAVPKNEIKKEQLRESKHEHIYLLNVLTGIIIFFCSLLMWIFFGQNLFSAILFISGIPNIVFAIYYTFMLIKLM